MIQGIAVILSFATLVIVPVLGGVTAHRYVTGRGTGNVRRTAAFTGGALMTAGAMVAINELTAPLGYGFAPRETSALAIIDMYQPGMFLLWGLAIAVFGWGIRWLGGWAERKLRELLRRQGRERAASPES
jgi:hypothetical protein